MPTRSEEAGALCPTWPSPTLRCVTPAGLRPPAPRAGTQAPWCCFSLLPRLTHPETPLAWLQAPPPATSGPWSPRHGGSWRSQVPQGAGLHPGAVSLPQVPQWYPELKWKRGLLSVSLRVRQPRLGRLAHGSPGQQSTALAPGPHHAQEPEAGRVPHCQVRLGAVVPTAHVGHRWPGRKLWSRVLILWPPQRALALSGWAAWGAGFRG